MKYNYINKLIKHNEKVCRCRIRIALNLEYGVREEKPIGACLSDRWGKRGHDSVEKMRRLQFDSKTRTYFRNRDKRPSVRSWIKRPLRLLSNTGQQRLLDAVIFYTKNQKEARS